MTLKEAGGRLAIEKGRLADIKDPVERTKSYITILRFLLDFIAGAARDHDIEALGSLADQYTSAIRSARDTNRVESVVLDREVACVDEGSRPAPPAKIADQ